ncbi:hypothetical protein [Trueperella bialowiezensis]|nr:hypothetical protein [Trueperella bialowiezensis]
MREKDSGTDWDAEWVAMQHKMAQERGFRTWSPPADDELVDEPFDPADLPDSPPVSPASRPDLARLFFLTTAAVALLFLLGFAGVIALDQSWWIVLGLIGFGSAAGGVFVSAPWAHNPDDDGTRV